MEGARIELYVATLADGVAPGLSSATGAHLAEAAGVALDRAGHASPTGYAVDGSDTADIDIFYGMVDDQARRTHNDQQELTEEGAVGVALTYLRARHGALVVNRAYKGSGVDYYLGPQELQDGPPFAETMRAEVTGLAQEDGNTAMNARRRLKQRQVGRPGAMRLPAWVVYVRFSRKLVSVDKILAEEAA